MAKGWFKESRRHSLASRGIKTAQKVSRMAMVNELANLLPKTKQILTDLARKNYIYDEDRRNEFIKFFKMRFPHHVSDDYVNESYANDWARRFGRNEEWFFADGESRKALKKVNPTRYKDYGKYEDRIKELSVTEFERFNNYLDEGFDPKGAFAMMR